MRQTRRITVPIVGGAAKLPSLDISAQETVNLYPEINQDTTEIAALVSCPGYTVLDSLGGGGNGFGLLDGDPYAFVGGKVYRVRSTGAVTQVGTGGVTGRVRSASNGLELAAVGSGTDGYVVTASSVSAIADADLEPVRDVAFLNQRIIWLQDDSARFQWSELLDATDYDALNFATAEGQPDKATAILSDGRLLYVGGERTIETFYDDGTGFSRQPQAVATKGVAARSSFVMFDNAPTFLGSDRGGALAVYRLLDGFNVQRISTNAVDAAINDYTAPGSAFAFSYFYRGHDFYVLTFPSQGTWVYDANTQLWHQRKSDGRDDWAVVDVARAHDRLYGLTEGGDVVLISGDAYLEGTSPMPRIRVTPPFSVDGKRFTVHRLEIECETGASDSTTPYVMEMAVSKDRGRTYGPWKQASIGRQGEYTKRVFWEQLGSFRDCVLKFRQADNAGATWLKAYADVEVMSR